MQDGHVLVLFGDEWAAERLGIVAVHSHLVPEYFRKYSRRQELQRLGCGNGHVLISC